ncbi:flagellar basal-body MS-ring/collar protein FliF [Teredinibacter sp. KSP-S5-2]|uniref:flagellar basal-body MS-ring/collar protein FliF n=1 Tax=Teredinibacter sp. KSP-S5-2 TaxID=3034506 RepID=UPI0029340EA8|nr:flagellar basal-body MS-ring/collar protein FliF [Teredinibacter sp. KSP-S5-2]WNO07922.1 flagellar basal-body MS-ring/collar protein FliF [Teredinibacter sp. KSP-S5-2]
MAADSLPTETGGTSDLIEGFNNLNLIRQAGLMIGLAASVAIGFAVVLWSQGEDYKPLYGSLDRLDSSEVGQILDFNEIPYKVDGSTGALMVPVDKVNKARLVLAENGIQGDKSVGYELLDQEQPLGTSQFMEATRYRRGLEGELARTIASINAVRAARVHLAIPKRTVFVRDGREPSASVFLDLFPGRPITPKQVRGIANLVASSIPELDIENVTVVDQKGNLMSVGAEDEKLVIAAQHLDYTRKIENDIVLRVRRLLTPLIGDGNFKTEVAADIDFTEIEQAEESFNPDLPAVRSEQTLEEQRVGSAGALGIPGALSNQPPNNGAAPQQAQGGNQNTAKPATPSNSRVQSTKNYELDRTVSYTKREKGRLRRLTVAVVVDDKKVPNADGGVERVRWTDTEIERLSILIRDAVGFSAVRGDSVNILNESFLPLPELETVEDLPIWETDWFHSIAKQAVGLLIILLLVVGLMRPVLKSLASAGVKAKEKDEARELAALSAAGLDSFDSLSDETVTLTGGDALALPSPEESYEQQLNAVKGLVAEDAGRVAQVIKRWINEE